MKKYENKTNKEILLNIFSDNDELGYSGEYFRKMVKVSSVTDTVDSSGEKLFFFSISINIPMLRIWNEEGQRDISINVCEKVIDLCQTKKQVLKYFITINPNGCLVI